jgi:hypothetical protein
MKKIVYHEKLNLDETDKFITFCAEFTTEVTTKNTTSLMMWAREVIQCSDVSEERSSCILR